MSSSSSKTVCRLIGVNGATVELPIGVANELFGIIKETMALAGGFADEDGGANPEDDEPLEFKDLQYGASALNAVKDYAMLDKAKRTTDIPKPLPHDLKFIVSDVELEMLAQADQKDYLCELVDCAAFLKFDALLNIVSAYMSERIEQIAREAPDIMEGAQRIRDFLHLKNEWTEEEMRHLRKEVEYAESVNPNAY